MAKKKKGFQKEVAHAEAEAPLAESKAEEIQEEVEAAEPAEAKSESLPSESVPGKYRKFQK